MENPDNKFDPIKLVETNVISKKGYYIARIIDADFQLRNGRQSLKVRFAVDRGKHQGFVVTTTFLNDFRSKVRLSYLCSAVGIRGELKSPGQLIGKLVKLRIVPWYNKYMGKSYLSHKITRFHPVGIA
jgi:hypothetical protein